MNLSGEMTCPLCKTDTDEELEHFLLHCPTFSSIRLNEFFKVFDSFVENQKYGLKLMELSSSAKLQFLIGVIGYAFNNEFGIFYDVHGKMFLICLGNCLLLLGPSSKNSTVSSWFAKQISWTVQQLSTTWTIFAISNMSTFVYTELSAALTTVLPVLFKCCYEYCYSDSRKL